MIEDDDIAASLERMREENWILGRKELERRRRKAAREAEKANKFRIGKKGGVTVYGVRGYFPVTLYKEEWRKLLSLGPELLKFIEEHEEELEGD